MSLISATECSQYPSAFSKVFGCIDSLKLILSQTDIDRCMQFLIYLIISLKTFPLCVNITHYFLLYVKLQYVSMFFVTVYDVTVHSKFLFMTMKDFQNLGNLLQVVLNILNQPLIYYLTR